MDGNPLIKPAKLLQLLQVINMGWLRSLHFSFYFIDDTMPPSIQSSIDAVKTQNPGFEVSVWGPAESRALIARAYPQFLKKYDAYPHAIQRSDFSRYAILHAVGGVYIDTDYVLKKGMAEIFAFLESTAPGVAAFVNESPNAIFLRRLSNSFMIAKVAGHPFWLHVMHTTSEGTGLSSHQRILTSTGPQAIDRSYRTYKTYKNTGRAIGVLPKQYFNPCSVCSRGNTCTKNDTVFAYHENAGGWNSSTSKMYNLLHCNMGWWIGLICCIITISVLTAVLVQEKNRSRLLAASSRRLSSSSRRPSSWK